MYVYYLINFSRWPLITWDLTPFVVPQSNILFFKLQLMNSLNWKKTYFNQILFGQFSATEISGGTYRRMKINLQSNLTAMKKAEREREREGVVKLLTFFLLLSGSGPPCCLLSICPIRDISMLWPKWYIEWVFCGPKYLPTRALFYLLGHTDSDPEELEL